MDDLYVFKINTKKRVLEGKEEGEKSSHLNIYDFIMKQCVESSRLVLAIGV